MADEKSEISFEIENYPSPFSFVYDTAEKACRGAEEEKIAAKKALLDQIAPSEMVDGKLILLPPSICVDVLDHEGIHTPLSLHASKGHDDVVTFLEGAGANEDWSSFGYAFGKFYKKSEEKRIVKQGSTTYKVAARWAALGCELGCITDFDESEKQERKVYSDFLSKEDPESVHWRAKGAMMRGNLKLAFYCYDHFNASLDGIGYGAGFFGDLEIIKFWTDKGANRKSIAMGAGHGNQENPFPDCKHSYEKGRIIRTEDFISARSAAIGYSGRIHKFSKFASDGSTRNFYAGIVTGGHKPYINYLAQDNAAIRLVIAGVPHSKPQYDIFFKQLTISHSSYPLIDESIEWPKSMGIIHPLKTFKSLSLTAQKRWLIFSATCFEQMAPHDTREEIRTTRYLLEITDLGYAEATHLVAEEKASPGKLTVRDKTTSTLPKILWPLILSYVIDFDTTSPSLAWYLIFQESDITFDLMHRVLLVEKMIMQQMYEILLQDDEEMLLPQNKIQDMLSIIAQGKTHGAWLQTAADLYSYIKDFFLAYSDERSVFFSNKNAKSIENILSNLLEQLKTKTPEKFIQESFRELEENQDQFVCSAGY